MRVLLLEDNAFLQKIAKRFIEHAFEGRNVDIDVTDRCTIAIELLTNGHFDLVVADFRVLDGTGDAVLRWVQKERPQLVEHFVFFSSSSEAQELHDKYIEKGCKPDEFAVQLRKLLPTPA